jgi:outer membrane protein assembly factor BamB
VLLVDQVQGSFMVAYDVRTGIESWKVSREDGALGGYSTPATRMSAAGRIELVVSGPVDAAGFDPVDGTRNWSVDGVTNSPVSVPLVSANRVFLCEPSFTENPFKMDVLLPFDKDKNGKVSLDELKSSIQLTRVARRVDERWGNGDGVVEAAELEMAFQGFVGGGGLVAIELDAAAGATKPRVLWSYRKQVPHIASLLLYNDILYFVNQGGILTSMDPASGEVLKRARVGHGSAYYASPVAADGKLYLIDAEGKLAVVSAEADWKVVATGDLGESCLATPAIVDGRIYVRTQRKLYCFGKAV